MTFRRRPFPEVLDNLLSDLAGGVAAEEHPFPPPGPAGNGQPYRHPLQRPPVAEVVSVYGSRGGQPRLFRKGKDWRLTGGQSLEWQEGAELPDPGTLLYVNYFPATAQPVLTDLQTGSVVRTLTETVGLEIARLYAQLEAVYQAGFVDTATGSALDNVVALLGIHRVQGGRAMGEVELRRVPGSRGIITIPAGTRVVTADGEVEYETTDTVTLLDGQVAIRVLARDLEPNDPLPADTLTVLPVPITGILSVTNPAPTAIATEEETDAELRERAKSFLHGSERATLGALKHAVARQQVTADVVEVEGQPWQVEVRPHAEAMPPELEERLLRAIKDARPAGIRVELLPAVAPAKVDLELRLTTAPGLPEADLRAAQRAVREKVENYFRKLPVREPGSVNRIVGLALSIPQVQDIRIESATVAGDSVLDIERGELDLAGSPTVLGELSIADPSLPTRVSVVVTHPKEATPDAPKIQAALAAALAGLSSSNESDPGAVLSYDAHLAPAVPASFQIEAAVTLESGATWLLDQSGDVYELTPSERLVLAGVEIRKEEP